MHPEGFIRRRRRVVAPSSSEIDLAGLVVPQYNRARENTHTHDTVMGNALRWWMNQNPDF
jgi:hypothetical protein